MSGIGGVWRFDAGPGAAADLLAAVRGALSDAPSERESAGSAAQAWGAAGLCAAGHARRAHGLATARTSAGLTALAFHGSLYGEPPARDGAAEAARLLDAYARDGVDFLKRIPGDVSLAIWEEGPQRLLVTTDRFRLYPIYYRADAAGLLFATRLKAILEGSGAPSLSIDPAAIVDVVSGSVIHTPRTIYREVRKLPPGHALVQTRGGTEVRAYWDLSFRSPSRDGEGELRTRLRAVFRGAIADRLAADGDSAKVGCFLSGGVDSTAVTGIVGQVSGAPVKSVSIGFEESGYDELSYARLAARALGAEHFEYRVTPEDACAAVPTLLESFDEPYANASAIPAFFCARLAREHGLDVLYAGDGGDELFGGNERYASLRVFRHYHRVPRWIRDPLLRPLVFGLARRSGASLVQRAKKYIQRASLPPEERFFSYSFFHSVPASEFLDEALLAALEGGYDPLAEPRRIFAEAPADTELDHQLYADLHVAISDNDLIKVTRAADAAGVEVRFPFLDWRLAEFAATVPAGIKMRGGKLRTFFKDAYADVLPPAVRSKTKHGFALPIPAWLKTDRRLAEMMRDLVLSERAMQRGYFRRKAVEDLIERHRRDTTQFYGTILWNLMMLELWHRRYR